MTDYSAPFKNFATENGISLAFSVVDHNPSPGMADDWEALHFQCRLVKGEKKSRPFYYSVGMGIVQRWAGKNPIPRVPRGEIAGAFQGRRTIHAENIRNIVVAHAKKKMAPVLGDILESLRLDCQSVECTRRYEDWADELGYDRDSRKGEQTYKLCQELAANLASFMGEQLFQDFLAIEPE